MTVRVSSASARKYRLRLNKDHGRPDLWHTTYIGTNKNIRNLPGRNAEEDKIPEDLSALYPVAFLVEQDPNTETRPHFHRADQFQVVVAGNGWLGAHPLGSVAVHYTSAYTPYGSIISSHAGLHYMTLRNGYDFGSRYMPESAKELRGVKRTAREAVSEMVHPLAPIELAASGTPSRLDVIPTETDGLGAWVHRLPPGEAIVGPDPRGGGGQYWIVLSGSLKDPDGDERFDSLSCAFVYPDDPPFEVRAGAAGLEIIGMQFPLRMQH